MRSTCLRRALTSLALLLVDSPDEADALAGKGLDQALVLAVVADRTAGGVDTGRKRDSETIRPAQIAAISSSRLTTCSLLRIR